MVINGKILADKIISQLKKEFEKLPRLTIGAVLVVPISPKATGIPAAKSGLGSKNPASMSFLNQKAKTAAALGVNFKIFKFDQKIKTEKLQKEILKLNKSKNIDGIIVQLPLPKHVDAAEILRAIDRKKDIDALSGKSLILSPVVEAAKFIFKKYKINYKDKDILIVGRGRLVGRPIYQWLSKDSVRVKIIDERQKNTLIKFARDADIIISGVGKGGLIKGEMIKRGAILIDFGFDRSSGEIRGDFDFESCAKKAKLITPVPGGMGPIMVAMLFRNLLKLSE